MRPNRLQVSSEFFTCLTCALCGFLPSIIHLIDVDALFASLPAKFLLHVDPGSNVRLAMLGSALVLYEYQGCRDNMSHVSRPWCIRQLGNFARISE